jgi:hypothetical protein
MRDAMQIAKKHKRLGKIEFDPVGYIFEKHRTKGYPFCEYDKRRIRLELKALAEEQERRGTK